MTLQPGKYLIKSKSQGTYIGRHVDEDRSLLPKRVLLLPPDFAPAPEVIGLSIDTLNVAEIPFSQWEVIMLDEGIYILKARSNHVTHFDNLVFAVLLPEPPATKWRIEAQPQHGQNIYTYVESMTNIDRRADSFPQRFRSYGIRWMGLSRSTKQAGRSQPMSFYQDLTFLQIIARPLISTPSFPPMFPTNELFEFIAVDS